jgi:hypothetical protein
MKQLRSLSDGAERLIGDEEREKYRPTVYQMLDEAIETLLKAYDELSLRVEEHRLKVCTIHRLISML